MKLRDARLCVDCELIFDQLRSMICGKADFTQCPECGSKSTLLLSTIIPTMAACSKPLTLITDTDTKKEAACST